MSGNTCFVGTLEGFVLDVMADLSSFVRKVSRCQELSTPAPSKERDGRHIVIVDVRRTGWIFFFEGPVAASSLEPETYSLSSCLTSSS